ncbi:LysE family translocator [Ectopseudomonas alcaliphila]|uniref:LysE family translocator n=1 Tax=Ectopseudomonas alcaliphila TaxID=101564 RepID=A0A1G7B9M7_9GAMM|nr:LysE family translocator [Pseudomonas alcaliphila]MDX5993230.1 LysE family translocator [Pseudomonas alcaliphila]SDE22955.1 Threonine/homoserine/homoserine lactone efflux protein [Pseudomonas alcaliphila]
MNQWLPFLLFASVASITPGPTNLLILGSAARFGLSIALAIAVGASLSASLMLLVVGLGLGELLARAPLLQTVMAWAGAVWISWMACTLMRADATGLGTRSVDRRQGFIQGAGLQLINPKTWLMTVSVTAIFLDGQASLGAVASCAALFLLVSTPCLLAWGVLGIGSARLLRRPIWLRLFNRCMALLLLASVWVPLLSQLRG